MLVKLTQLSGRQRVESKDPHDVGYTFTSIKPIWVNPRHIVSCTGSSTQSHHMGVSQEVEVTLVFVSYGNNSIEYAVLETPTKIADLVLDCILDI